MNPLPFSALDTISSQDIFEDAEEFIGVVDNYLDWLDISENSTVQKNTQIVGQVSIMDTLVSFAEAFSTFQIISHRFGSF